MNNTQWMTHTNNTTEFPPSNMTMTNHSQAPVVPPTSNSTTNLSIKITLFLILAIVFIVIYLARSYDRQQRQQQQDKAQEDAAESQEQFRTKLIQKMTKEKLTMTLTSLNFQTGNDNTTSTALDIEQGGEVPVVDVTTGVETLPVITEVGDSVENHCTQKNSKTNDCDKGERVGEPSPNNHVNLKLVVETLDDKTEQDVQHLSNEENIQLPDLEAGTTNITHGSKRHSRTVSIRESVKSILQKKRKSRRSTTGSSMQSEIFLTRAENPLSIRNECAICLDGYNAGDVIAWSGNDSCKHVFHQECILDYLVQRQNQEAPCPCCRRVFLPKGSKSSITGVTQVYQC